MVENGEKHSMQKMVFSYMNRERWAQLGIGVQFLALVRILGEYFRLKHAYGAGMSLAIAEPLIRGALADAALCFAAVLLFFLKLYRSALLISVATLVLLLIYKFHLLGSF